MDVQKTRAAQPGQITHHGRKIKYVRLLKGYTLKQLAELVGCSESMVSKVENSRLSPSLAMLNRIAVALDVGVPDLLLQEGDDLTDGKVTVFPANRFEISGTDKDEARAGVWFDRILPFGREGLLQVQMLHLEPGAEQPRFLHHEGEELIFVLDGVLDVIVEDQTYRVGRGDMIYFSSMLDHRYGNTGDSMARAFWVNTPPTM
ncbi:MAG TPA: XRE family transcriptional regulator [Roseovarius sp.]|uniref:helix-turn-helix domain-containing protein n=1 Tax=Marivita sp. TaxID=2003365 RepID=UPI0025C70AA8|nr:XRE family transcriptional regulator [Marivita sp.]HKL45767.1 XRE family transcriptional regulator [Roseovarius sp.]